MSRAHNRIDLRPNHTRPSEGPIADTVTILPGMCIELQTSGRYAPLVSATADAIKGEIIIADMDGLQGRTVDDAYSVLSAGDDPHPVFYHIPNRGDEFNILVKDGESVDEGDYVVPEAGGLWIEATAQAQFIFKCIETVTPVVGQNVLIACRRV